MSFQKFLGFFILYIIISFISGAIATTTIPGFWSNVLGCAIITGVVAIIVFLTVLAIALLEEEVW